MNQSLSLLFDPATVNQNIFHYAEKPRKNRFDIKVNTEYESKCEEALHFAFETEWRDCGSACEESRDYQHKYQLLNISELKILDISPQTILNLLTFPMDGGPNWCKLRQCGYDGVFVDYKKFKLIGSLPSGFNRWRYFANKYDVDTFVIWRNAEIQEVPNDWPEKSKNDRLAYEKWTNYIEHIFPVENAKRSAEMDSPPECERLKRRNSCEIRMDRINVEVEVIRQMFPTYDKIYPLRPSQ